MARLLAGMLALIMGAGSMGMVGGNVTDLLNQTLAPGAVGQFNSNSHIAAIRVDNNSGSFLQVSTTGSFIPPYTRGWSEDLGTGAASVTLTPVTGPQGQPTSTAGGTSYVSLFDKPIGYNAGSGYVQQTNPPILTSVTQVLNVSGPPGSKNLVQSTVIPAVAGKRIAITAVQVTVAAIQGDYPNALWHCDVITLAYKGATSVQDGDVSISGVGPGQNSSSIVFSTPFVTPSAGDRIDATGAMSSAFDAFNVWVTMQYYYF